MLFSTGRAVCTLHIAHLDNSELTNHLFPYLQQNIIHTVSIMLSKAIQPLSKNYPHNYQHTNTNHNFQLITTILVSFITQQFTHCQPISQQFIFLEWCIWTHLTQHVSLSNPFSWSCIIWRPNRTDLVCHAIQSLSTTWCI